MSAGRGVEGALIGSPSRELAFELVLSSGVGYAFGLALDLERQNITLQFL